MHRVWRVEGSTGVIFSLGIRLKLGDGILWHTMLEEGHRTWVKKDVTFHDTWCSGTSEVSAHVRSSRSTDWCVGIRSVIVEGEIIEYLSDVG